MPNFPKVHASPEDLAQWLESHLESIKYVSDQQHKLFGGKGTNDFEMMSFRRGHTVYDRTLVLASSFKAFDSIFFNDTLDRRAQIELVDPKAMPGALGHTLNLLMEVPATVIPISPATTFCQIHLADISEDAKSRSSSRSLIETLLHEMIHAFFITNSCRCSLKCKERYERQKGVTGHGTSWMKTALQIEKAMNQHFEGNWDLNRSVSFAEECFHDPTYDKTAVPQALLRGFELSDLVEQQIRHWKDKAAKQQEEEDE